MISSDKFLLRPIWDATLEIYKEIAKICNRHGLRYYVTDGTLIGAIRHKGFIPWDDDFDMSMPRPDYERFIEYAKTELPENLKFVNWKNTPEFHLMFGKVQECNEKRILELEHGSGVLLSNGLFVDVFPIDGYPESKFVRRWILLLNFLFQQVLSFRYTPFSKRSWKGKLMWFFGGLCSVCFMCKRTYSDFLRIYEKLLLKYRFDDCSNTGRASVALHVFRKKPLPKIAWGDGVLHEFHDTQVRIPSDADAYLKGVYGDYMKLPPENKQHPTHNYGYRCPWWLGPTKAD